MSALHTQECRIGSPVGVVPLFKRPPRQQAFTLVELLVVIAIIALLVGFTVPMVRRGQEAALRSRAMTEINTIVRAVEAYHREYGRYPQGSREYRNGNGVLIDVLRAADRSGDNPEPLDPLNPRNYNFLGVDDHSLSGDRRDTNRDFLDPWGEPYRVIINPEGTIPNPFGGNPVRRSVVAWSMGDAEEDPNRALKSW